MNVVTKCFFYRKVDYLRQDLDRRGPGRALPRVMTLNTHSHTYRNRCKEGVCEGTTAFKLNRTKNLYRVHQQIRNSGEWVTLSVWESLDTDSL